MKKRRERSSEETRKNRTTRELMLYGYRRLRFFTTSKLEFKQLNTLRPCVFTFSLLVGKHNKTKCSFFVKQILTLSFCDVLQKAMRVDKVKIYYSEILETQK